MAGVLTLSLVEYGQLNIDHLIRSYVPSLPSHQTHTLRQLLPHYGGVGDYSKLGTPPGHYDTALAASRTFWDKPPLVAPPGTKATTARTATPCWGRRLKAPFSTSGRSSAWSMRS